MKCNFMLLTLCLFSVVSRISPSFEPARTCFHFASDLPDVAYFSPTLLMCSNWNSPWKPRYLRSGYRSSFFTSCILLLSGDIEVNPGPGPRYPCGFCTKAVRSTSVVFFAKSVISGFTQDVSRCLRMSTSDSVLAMKDGVARSALRRHSLSPTSLFSHVLPMPMTLPLLLLLPVNTIRTAHRRSL